MSSLPEILIKYKDQVLGAKEIIAIVNEASASQYRPIDIAHIEARELRGFVFHVERYRDCLEELKPLHAAHWQETEKYRQGLALAPDYSSFVRLEDAGRLVLFTIRKDGELVGHTTMKVFGSMHTKTLVAEEDSLFLREDQRGSLALMLAFIRYASEGLGSVGVREIRVGTKLINGADKLLRRAGFEPYAIQLVKMIGEANQ